MAARGFPYADLKDFLAALESAGELRRVDRAGRPHAGDQRGGDPDRPGRRPGAAVRAADPRRDAGGDQPVRHRAADGDGARRRLARRDRRPDRRAGQAGAAGRLVRHPRRPGQGAAAQVGAAEEGQDRALPAGRLPGRRRRPEPAARPAGLARRRRHLPQLRADPHQAPGDRQAQPRPLPAAAALAQHARHALADPQGLDRAPRGRRAPGRAAAGRDRDRLRPGGQLRGQRAAARRHRRIPVRRLPARRAGRDGRLPDRAAAGAGARADRAGGLPRAGRAAAGGPVRRPHRLLHPGRAVPGAAHRVHDHAARPDLPLDHHLASRRRRTTAWARPPSGSSCRCSSC